MENNITPVDAANWWTFHGLVGGGGMDRQLSSGAAEAQK